MVIDVSSEIVERLSTWSIVNQKSPEVFVNETLERSLEDWEDYGDAVRICAEVDAGRMKTYSMEEVWKELDELDD